MLETPSKRVVLLHGELKTPPLSLEARVEAGQLLRRLQEGELLTLPQSRPMPSIGRRCHELRINDQSSIWRVIYRIDEDVIVVAEVFSKKLRKRLYQRSEFCQARLARYDEMEEQR